VLGLDPRFAILDDADQLSLLKQAMHDLELDDKRFAPRAILSAISAAKSELVTGEDYARQADGAWPAAIGRVFLRYEELLAANHGLDFDDLLGHVVRMLRECPDVLAKYQDRYSYLMVDEFQDTNLAQYELVRLLGQRDRNVCVVGDEDQSIYGWRKADVRNLAYFERDFPELRIVMLEQNYRSTQTILDVASSIINPNPDRKPKRLWTENPPGVPVVMHQAYDENDEALFVIRQVEALRRAGATYSDVAVTYRTNAQSRALEDALVRYGVPYRLVGGTRFYQRREVKDIVAYLKLVANPSDGVSFQRVVNVPARGIGAKTVSDLQMWAARKALPLYEVSKLAANGDEEIDETGRITPVVPMATRPRMLLGQFVSIIEAARERLSTGTLGEVLNLIVERTEFKDSLQDGTDEGNDRWQNVVELQTKLADFDGLAGPEALDRFLEEVALVQDVDSLESGESDAITLITLHAAKGLEFPFVFIVGLEEGIVPHIRSIESRPQLEEERRLLYVGATRAMRGLFLVHTFRRTMWGNESMQERSRFLDDIPLEFLDQSFSQAVGGRTRSNLGARATRFSAPSAPMRRAGFGGGRTDWPPRRDPYGDLDSGSSDLGADRDLDHDADLGVSERPEPRAITPPPAARARPRSASGAAATGRMSRFARAERVRHPDYGEGTVIATSIIGSEELVLVRFDMRPEQPKNLSLAIHRLEHA
jgi:DNA helicase-2/ATP-dependent DNA helicase PcrA